MNSLLRIPYSFAGNLAQALTRVAPAGQSKFARALTARRDLIHRFQEWSTAHRDPARPLLWFHAPSVGEGLQALPIIQLLRARRPDIQIAYTFYSPSAERFANSLDVDVADYLPFDTFSNAAAAIEALRPSALVFSKLDVWPALTETASGRGIPVGVVSATLPESSGRRGPIARAFLNDAYRSITRVGAIDESDAARLREQGVRADRLQVTGDTRFDQVWTRAQRDPAGPVERLRSARPTLVAGSTWPTDEEHLLPAWQRIREKIPDARLVIAPHEISESHLRNLARWATASSLKPALIDAADATAADVIIVDRYGVLGDLYSLADVAYVGGGFHSAGVHSVLEPAAFGAPVLFGPRHERSREATRLVQAEGGANIKGSADLTIRLDDWLGSSSAREVAGAHARAMVQAGLGAAERSYKLVMALLPE